VLRNIWDGQSDQLAFTYVHKTPSGLKTKKKGRGSVKEVRVGSCNIILSSLVHLREFFLSRSFPESFKPWEKRRLPT
jgi:hypothetical protein